MLESIIFGIARSVRGAADTASNIVAAGTNIISTILSTATDNRFLSKLAYREEFEGDTEHRTTAYTSVHEDAATCSTYKLPLEVEFRKKSNEDYYRET